MSMEMTIVSSNVSISTQQNQNRSGSSAIPVLFVHYGDDWIRGSETVLLDLLRHIDRQKIQPIVWCNGTCLENALKDMRITVYRSDLAYYGLEESPQFSPRQYVRQLRQGLNIIRRHRIRVLHSNSAGPTQWLWPVAKAARVPLVSHLHIDYQRRSRYLFGLHHATLVVGVSKDAVAALVHDGMPQHSLKVIYNGIDTQRLGPTSNNIRQRLGIPSTAVVIGTVGSLIRRKGHDILLRAFRSIADHNSHAALVIASDGEERPRLQQLAADLGIQHRVHFLGYFSDIGALYRDCIDIFAIASRADAFGLVIAEANMFGIPAVGTNVGGIPEVIEHDRTGFIVPPEDPNALAERLLSLIADPRRRVSMGQAAKLRAQTLFSATAMTRAFQDTYYDLASMSRSTLGWRSIFNRLAPYRSLLLNSIVRK